MTPEITALAITAATFGFFHTLFGPDHYLPFIVMNRAAKWSKKKTLLITFLCGIGHVASSVVLGLIGVAVGIGVGKLEAFEGIRGNIAAWLLIGFGFAYFVWGIWRAIKGKTHSHTHSHGDGAHSHEHAHTKDHVHVHEHAEGKRNLTPWILFTIFVFGPCEPLIPILMYPAAKHSINGMLLVTAVFAATTIATMMTVVLVGILGLGMARFGKMERYTHALAGGAICLSGLAIQVLGL